jgi:plastocyanin
VRTILTAAAIAVGVAFTGAACGDGSDGGTAEPTGATGATGNPAAPEPPASRETVTVETFIFSPDPLAIATGTEVTFENLDGTVHTATAGTREEPDPDTFDLEVDEGASASFTFGEPGTYPYFCRFHSGPGMTGEITVE